MHRNAALLFASLLFASCSASSGTSDDDASEPNWETYRSVAANGGVFAGDAKYKPNPGIFVFRDLKSEGDASLAHRLLGEVGQRIVYIERNRERWQYYSAEDDPIDSLVLYSRPESWGSAYGICRTEKYEISFTDDGKIESVIVTPRYGVEGPIFQKKDFNWEFFREKMCEAVPGNHMPSYFPADDVLDAKDLAILLTKAIDLAGRHGNLPYELNCQSYRGDACAPSIREYLATLKLQDIDETSQINCSYPKGPGEHCYTVTVGKNKLGPFPKKITIHGSTYMNNWYVHLVDVREGYTVY